MTKAKLAELIDAYADAKTSGNKYLVQSMIGQLESALNEVCNETEIKFPSAPLGVNPEIIQDESNET